MKHNLLVVISSVIILLGIVIYGLWYFNVSTIFERKFEFTLPKTVEIIDTSYSLYYDTLKLKASFQIEDYMTITEGMKNYAKRNAPEVNIESKEELIPIRAFCKLWREEKEEALKAYCGYLQGRWGAKTRMVCILVTKDKKNENKYYLHVFY